MESSFDAVFEKAKEYEAYWIADAILSFTIQLDKLTKESGLSRKDLAERLGTSPAYISKIFRGNANFTIESMVRLARAVGAQVHVHLAPENQEVRWFRIINSGPQGQQQPKTDRFTKVCRAMGLDVGNEPLAA